MGTRFHIDYDERKEPYHIFSCENTSVEAVRKTTIIENNVNYFWQVRILPDVPIGHMTVIAQRRTLDEAIKTMLQYMND